ncbi:MAG: hypothetical protein KGJ60_11835 [Verrucomicrobiota bacterium]|nr:hypothetical protein [Verrucomicrobiota bacterium]
MIAPFLQPEGQPFPVARVSFKRPLSLAMAFQILRNPGIPPAAADFSGMAVEFFGFKLGAQRARLDGLTGVICPQAGGLVAPRVRIYDSYINTALEPTPTAP